MKKLTIIILLLGINYSCNTEEDPNIPKPNIIIIMADDLGYGDLSSYGNPHISTPHIDSLFAEGVKFTDFHSNGSVCSPTRAALMTGKYQQRTGIAGVITAANHRDVGLSLDEITLAEELKSHGYNTAMYGKWHLGYASEFNPIHQGFDEFVGFVSGNVDYHGHIDQEGYLDWWKGDNIENEEGYTTDLITDYGVQYIEQNNPETTGKPFFLYLPHEAPHSPFQKRIDSIYRTVDKPGTRGIKRDSIPSIYKEMVEVMDEGIGKIVQSLKTTGQYNNTIILFLSDNGANRFGSNHPLRGFKAQVYEGGTRVPALISYPDKIKSGSVSHQPALTVDVLPTLLDVIGKAPSSDNIDGISLKDHLMNDAILPERDFYYAFKGYSYARSGDWKLIRKVNDDSTSFELYNLAKDLPEFNDLSLDNPRIVNKLNAKLDSWFKEVYEGVEIISD